MKVETEIFRLSHSQEGIWLECKSRPASTEYNLACAIQGPYPLDFPRLQAAVQRFVEQHAILRMRLQEVDGETFQYLAPSETVVWQIHDLNEAEAVSLEDRLRRDAHQPFDLFQGPSFRVQLYRCPKTWYFQFCAHHITLDGYSGELFVEQVMGHYLQSETPVPHAIPGYQDFVAWQRGFAQTPEGREHGQFWRHYLQDFASSQPEYALPSEAAARDQHIKIAVPDALYQKILMLQKSSGVTAFTIMLAAYARSLSLYNGRDTQYCIIPSYNRPGKAYFQVPGHFVNNIFVRIDVKPDITVLECLRASYQSLKLALKHQSYPIHQVLNDLNLHAYTEKEAALAIGFGWLRQNRDTKIPAEYRIIPSEQSVTNSGLLLTFFESPQGIQGELHVRAGTYSRKFLETFIQDYLHGLEQLCRFPDRTLQEAGSLTDEHIKQRASYEWGSIAPLSPQTVLDRYQVQAEKRPEAPALFFEGQELSYGALNQRVDRIAQGLLRRGVDRGSVVGVAMDRGFDLIAGLLATLKLGAAYIPIDPQLPSERMAFMLDDAKACLLLTASTYAESFASMKSCVNVDEFLKDSAPEKPIANRCRPEDTCYIVYTSGSTGRPKGVAIDHRAILNQMDALNCQHELNSQDVVGSFTTISFDIFAAEFLLPLSNGMKLALLDTEDATDPGKLGRFLNAADVSFCLCTPIILRSLVRSPWQGRKQLQVLCGGEVFPGEIVADLQGKFKAVWNGYGPTEATVCASAKRINVEPDVQSIGRPFQNYHLSIRDFRQRRLALGGTGEICISGPGLAQGYIGRPELNQEKFVEDPEQPGQRLYRTGDLGLWSEQGELRILGRLDDQVKLRGLRIELGEIEALLDQFPEIREAKVILHKESSSLIACVVTATADVDTELWESRLLAQLPDYMVPRSWQFMPSIPRLASGKLDRQTLLRSIRMPEVPGATVKAGNQTEESLENLVCVVLRRETFGMETPFFASGVESIQLMQIAAEIKAVFQVQLEFRQLVELGTLRQIARVIDGRIKDQGPSYVPPTPGSVRSRYPVSLSQRRMWVLQRLHPETIAYNMPVVLRIQGSIDSDLLHSAFRSLMARHDVLKTAYIEVDGLLQAIIRDTVPDPFQILDLRSLDKETAWNQAQTHMRAQLEQAFDLAAAPLIRISLLHLPHDDNILLVNKHHIISDQWSYGIFFKELTRLYQKLPLEPESLPIRYVDYAIWQEKYWDAQQQEKQLSYWKNQLQGVGVVEIRPDFPRPATQTSRGGIIRATLPDQLIADLLRLGRQEHLTPYMILLGCFQIFIHKHTGLTDVQVGSPVANRTESATAHTMGTFVNTIVLRTQLDGNPTFLSFMDQVRRTTLDAFQHQDISFETLVQSLGIERDLSHTPLVQVLFNVVNTPFELTVPEGWQLAIHDADPVGAQFDLSVTIDYKVTRELLLNYNSDLYKRSSAERFARHFLTIVSQVLANPGIRVGDIELLNETERQTLLIDWNRTARSWPSSCFLNAVEGVARSKGKASALFSAAGSLTYEELWVQSDQIARFLLSEGVKPGDFVGVHMERVPLLLPILLGVMKAGAAYLPLDPYFPEQRVAYYLTDSKATLLISDRANGQAPEAYTGKILTTSRIMTCLFQPLPRIDLPAVSANTLAYIIYTSGSTGLPKGVPIHHGALANFLYSMAEMLPNSADDTLLAVTSVSFDIHGLEVFMPIIQGARIYLANKDETLSGQKLRALIREHRIQMMQATPTTWRLLLDAGWEGQKGFRMLCGGEAFPRELVRALLPKVDAIWNLYGPTETTIWSSAHRIISDSAPLYIGKPIANTQIYILDAQLKPVPTQVSGELYIGGDGLSPGYYQRPELTSERFISHDFGQGLVTRIYRTGDNAVWHEDGLLECLGRVDNQIKLNGFRIEIGEIEAHLARILGSQDCAVVLKKIDGSRDALVAYLVASTRAGAFDPQPILRRMGEFLPTYMVPSYLVPLDALPLTPNLKVDYKALRSRQDAFVQAAGKTGPQNALEAAILAVWQEVLGIQAIGRADNFFNIGGDSITANRMVLALSKKFEADVPLKLVFLDPTIQGLAQTLRTHYPVRDFRIVFPVKKADPEFPLFLVPGAYDHASRIAGYENDVLRYFANLLPHFPSRQSVYGLRMIGIYPDETPLFTAEEIAACYRAEIRRIQPEGPYFLAGECVGGLIAYELAQQLQQDGQEVAYLGLYDTVNPTRAYVVQDVIYFFLLRLRDMRDGLKQFVRADTEERQSMLDKTWQSIRGLKRCLSWNGLREAILRSDYYTVFSLLRYQPKPYAGRVTLISNESYLKQTPQLNWDRVVIENLRLHKVPGNHVTRLSEYSQEMGRTLRSTLEEARQELTEQEPAEQEPAEQENPPINQRAG